LKAIMIMFDSLNRHMLPPYGCDWTHAPNFQRLARHTAVFDNAYVGSMPCAPARRDLQTGRYNFLHRSWGPIEPFDDSFAEILQKSGVYTHLTTDHQHYFEDGGATYHTRYNSWEFHRGQEGDMWKGEVADPDIPETINPSGSAMHRQDWINRKYMASEADMPLAKTFAGGMEFIRTNHAADNWFLQIETFDPHEPFFTLPSYKELYPHDYDGPHFDWPSYRQVTESAEQVEHIRYEYAALLSMCDNYLGRVLDMMDELDMWKDTMLIVNTDHGFLLGEHDWWAKCIQPFYNEVARIPLFIWDPRAGVQDVRRQSLVQNIDMAPTLLDYFGVPVPKDMQGKPLKDTIRSDRSVRDYALFGIHGGHVNITDGNYVYMRAPARPDNQPLYNYTLMPTHMRSRFSVGELQELELAPPFAFTKGCRTLKIQSTSVDKSKGHIEATAYRFGTLLYDLRQDPTQDQPIRDQEVESRMCAGMKSIMMQHDAPSEQYIRLGL